MTGKVTEVRPGQTEGDRILKIRCELNCQSLRETHERDSMNSENDTRSQTR